MRMNKKGGKVVTKSSKIKSRKKEKVLILKGPPKDLPSLFLAYQLTERASRLGFDWPDLKGVLKKLDEEMKEFREALSIQNRKKIREELGDLLFVLVNLSRFLGINPEEALRKTLEKFTSRFHYIETSLRKKGKTFHQSNLMEMDQLWEKSKKKRRRMT